jgi:exodeoxyribonuclease V beta subunit
MQTYNSLDGNSPARGHFFLEASAGTGKTFTIEHLVVRLLITEPAMTIDEILIVTFTRAATRDLKQRIHQTLQRSLIQWKEESFGAPDYLKVFFGDETVFLRLERALCLMEKAEIYTIHSFCMKMLSTYAFDAKMPFALESRDNREILDILRSLEPYEDFSPSQIFLLLQSHGKQIERLCRSIMTKPLNIEKGNSFKASFEKFSSLVEKIPDFDDIKNYKSLFNRQKELHPHFQEQIMLMHPITKEGFDELLMHRDYLFNYIKEENRKAGFEGNQSLEGFAKEASDIIREAIDPKITLSRLTNHTALPFSSPDDFLTEMQSCLTIRSFTHKIKGRFKAAIIDEFQDTDPAQWEIFRSLFVDDPIPFFSLVGDPKQSIYGFRRADLSTFVKAKNSFTPDQHLILSKNYRSHPRLIEVLNYLFDERSHWLSLEKTAGPIQYTPIQPKEDYPEPLIDDEKGALHFFLTKQSQGRSRKWPTEEVEETVLFPSIVKEIQHLSEKGISYKQIVILIKDRFQGDRISCYLRKFYIPTMTSSTSHLKETRMFKLFYNFLEVLEKPTHVGLVKKLLSHSPFGWSLDDLALSIHDSPFQHTLSRIKGLEITYRERGLGASIEELLELPLHPEKPALIVHLLSTSYLDDYRDFIQLTEIAIEEHASLRELILKMESFLSIEPEEDSRLKRKTVHQGDFVQIMTTHMSKGLEFDVVFGLGLLSRHSDEPSLEKDREKMRLFYVALTRAKRRVYLPFCEITDQKKCPLGTASPIELFFSRIDGPLGWQDGYDQITNLTTERIKKLAKEKSVSISFEDIVEETLLPSTEKTTYPILIPPIKIEPKATFVNIQSFSKVQKKKTTSSAEDPSLPKGAKTGAFFHELFEDLLSYGFYQDELLIEKVAEKAINESPFYPWKEKIITMLKEAFSTKLLDFSLKDIPHSALLQEMEFLFKKEGIYWKGFVDVVFFYDNLYYILDWKLHALEDYGKESLKKTMEDYGYKEQATIYSDALKTIINEKQFGGAFYFFVRGPAVYYLSPEVIG